MIRYLAIVLAVSLLFGCTIPKANDGGNHDTGTGGQGSGGDAGQGGEVIVVQEEHSSGGMSDPSRCNNLPPQQMADCLEQAMGG